MAPQRPEYYVIDESTNYSSTNAKTQTDILYFERDTGKCKLGTGERWNDVEYYTPGIDVRVDDEIKAFLSDSVSTAVSLLNFEPLIEDKKSAFNKDFGETADSVSRGKHKHSTSDLLDLRLPKGINFPEKPSGTILFDDETFKPIPISNTASQGNKDAISSDWASRHEASKLHLTPEQIKYIHLPVTVSGSGLSIDNQTISLQFLPGPKGLCTNDHFHREYAPLSHSHSKDIDPSRLPAISRNDNGAVPPTGNPSGRSLHDDGTWRYPASMSIIPLLQSYWVAPCDGILSYVAMSSDKPIQSGISINAADEIGVRMDASKLHGFYDGRTDVNKPFKQGDVFQVTSEGPVVSLGIIINR